MNENPLLKLETFGQSVWMDFIRRGALTSGELKRLIDEHGARFHTLAAQGARPQRLLWASTSTKNPAYSDVKYVEPLVGAETINTLP